MYQHVFSCLASLARSVSRIEVQRAARDSMTPVWLQVWSSGLRWVTERFYVAPVSTLEQAHSARVACDSEWVEFGETSALFVVGWDSDEKLRKRRFGEGGGRAGRWREGGRSGGGRVSGDGGVMVLFWYYRYPSLLYSTVLCSQADSLNTASSFLTLLHSYWLTARLHTSRSWQYVLGSFPSRANTMLLPSAKPKLRGIPSSVQRDKNTTQWEGQKWSGTDWIRFIHNWGHGENGVC